MLPLATLKTADSPWAEPGTFRQLFLGQSGALT